MKLPKDLGRKESLAGIAAVVLVSFVYACLLLYVIRGSFFPQSHSAAGSVKDNLLLIVIMVVCVEAAILTVRPLYRLYLKIRAYHVKKGSEWQSWRDRSGGDHENA